MNETTEIEKLVAALETEPPETQICFYEESDISARYALTVETADSRLLSKLARLFGCLDKKIDWMD